MRILLVQSHLGRIVIRPALFPLGLCYLATALKDHVVEIFDMNLWEVPESFTELKHKIADFLPDIIGISLRNVDTTNRTDPFYYYKTLQPTAELLKSITPNVPLIIGGPGFSMFPKRFMELYPIFDFGVFLDGEESFPELLNNLDKPSSVRGIYYRENGQVHFSGERQLPDFAKLPIPKREAPVIDIKPYIGEMQNNIGIQSKRGCVLECVYCNYPALSGSKLRYRSPQQVVDEIEYLISLGVKSFSFVDNIFNVPLQHAHKICQEIIDRGLDVRWSAWFEIKRTDEEFMRLAVRAGCSHFGFSPDGGTDRALSVLKKRIVLKDIYDNLKLVKKIPGVRVGYNLFCMLPGMTMLDFVKTIILYFKISIMLGGRGHVGLGWVRIYPHTEMLRMAIAEGYLDEDTELLPEDVKDFDKMFYLRRSYKPVDRLMIVFNRFMKELVKPAAKAILNFIHRKNK